MDPFIIQYSEVQQKRKEKLKEAQSHMEQPLQACTQQDTLPQSEQQPSSTSPSITEQKLGPAGQQPLQDYGQPHSHQPQQDFGQPECCLPQQSNTQSEKKSSECKQPQCAYMQQQGYGQPQQADSQQHQPQTEKMASVEGKQPSQQQQVHESRYKPIPKKIFDEVLLQGASGPSFSEAAKRFGDSIMESAKKFFTSKKYMNQYNELFSPLEDTALGEYLCRASTLKEQFSGNMFVGKKKFILFCPFRKYTHCNSL